MSFRTIERDVYVAHGAYGFKPINAERPRIEIFGEQLTSGGGGGSGSFTEFLNWVGMWIDQPIVNDVDMPVKERITWHYNLVAGPLVKEEERRLAKDPQLVLKYVTEQTEIAFTKEKRKVRLLVVERKK